MEKQVTVEMQHLLEVLQQNVNSDPRAAVREYVSNAHDACLGQPDPLVRVWSEDGQIHIADNGCGMTEGVIYQAFTRIAGHHAHTDGPTIGKFGLGVLSAFMVSDRLVVETRSAKADTGWRLEWGRGQDRFVIEPIRRREGGTTATFCLSDDCRDMSSEAELRDYISTTFGMSTMPIRVGQSTEPVNVHYRWLAAESALKTTRLLPSPEVRSLVRGYCHLDVDAVYGAFLEDGTRILLGIPSAEFSPLDLHRVVFFSRGVQVHGNLRAFFPENLAFVVGLVDSPDFALQISREGLLIKDKVFTRIQDSIEPHLMSFLELLAAERPRAIEVVMRTHRTMLLAHSRRQPRLRELLRRHYRFTTNMGEKSWGELLALAQLMESGGGSHEPTLFVLSNQSAELQVLPVAGAKGHPVVLATLGERTLLVEIARADGVRIADAGGLMDAALLAHLPEPFRALGARLAAPLRRHRIGNVAFFQLPGERALPVMFRIVSSPSRSSPASTAKREQGEETLLRIEALMLNVAHPLIERLAARALSLDAAALARAADVLYCVAALNSPLEDVGSEVSDLVVSFLVEILGEGVGPPTIGGGLPQPKCFVALPYRGEFDPVWRAVRSVLTDEPYCWEVIRGDEDVRVPDVLAGIAAHLAASRRFVADVSNSNPNVMLELGMMLARDARSTLVLADADAFTQLPADLRGHICLVYPPGLRSDEAGLRRWFAENVTRHPEFIAMRGAPLAGADRG